MRERRLLGGDPSPREEALIYISLAVVVVALLVGRSCIPEKYHHPAERTIPPATPPESLYQPKEPCP